MGLRPSDPYLIFFDVCSVLGTCFDGKSNNVGSLVLGKQKFEVITLQFPLCPSSNTFDNRVLQPSSKQISTAYIATPASRFQQSMHGCHAMPRMKFLSKVYRHQFELQQIRCQDKVFGDLGMEHELSMRLGKTHVYISIMFCLGYPHGKNEALGFFRWQCYLPSLCLKVLEYTQTEILGVEYSTNPTTLGGLA